MRMKIYACAELECIHHNAFSSIPVPCNNYLFEGIIYIVMHTVDVDRGHNIENGMRTRIHV